MFYHKAERGRGLLLLIMCFGPLESLAAATAAVPASSFSVAFGLTGQSEYISSQGRQLLVQLLLMGKSVNKEFTHFKTKFLNLWLTMYQKDGFHVNMQGLNIQTHVKYTKFVHSVHCNKMLKICKFYPSLAGGGDSCVTGGLKWQVLSKHPCLLGLSLLPLSALCFFHNGPRGG